MSGLDEDEDDLRDTRARTRAFLAGRAELTGLDLYQSLERCTELIRFHTIPRRGAGNRCRNGLQQSYGDHNRLLLLGLDMLEAGDVEWYLSRVERPGAVDRAEIEACIASVSALRLDREARLSLWLAAALHDFGMFAPADRGLDVENAVALCAPLLDALCVPALRGLVEFAIRNHDFIKDVWSGEIPAGFIARQAEALSPSLRGTALSALGMIQVAGSASLGEGRLSCARLEIARRCFDGTALADLSPETRLARLLAENSGGALEDSRRRAAAWIGGLAAETRDETVRLLESVPLHGWWRVRAVAGEAYRSAEAQRGLLQAIGASWARERPPADHVVLGDRFGETLRRGLPEPRDDRSPVERLALLNGTRALVFD